MTCLGCWTIGFARNSDTPPARRKPLDAEVPVSRWRDGSILFLGEEAIVVKNRRTEHESVAFTVSRTNTEHHFWLSCGPSNTKICIADQPIHSFGDRTVELLILIAHRSVPGFDVPTVEFDDLECKHPNSIPCECRPSNFELSAAELVGQFCS